MASSASFFLLVLLSVFGRGDAWGLSQKVIAKVKAEIQAQVGMMQIFDNANACNPNRTEVIGKYAALIPPNAVWTLTSGFVKNAPTIEAIGNKDPNFALIFGRLMDAAPLRLTINPDKIFVIDENHAMFSYNVYRGNDKYPSEISTSYRVRDKKGEWVPYYLTIVPFNRPRN